MEYFLRIALVVLIFLFNKGENFGQYASPVRHKILLGGAFGELRGTHFHAGIDIKPTRPGYEGDAILSIADGYVSRIKTQRGGYGRAVYIDHPTGQRSVYAHLSSLSDKIQRILTAEQKSRESYEVDLYLSPHQIVVKKGEFLGTMGNAGRSFGSHLHFEIRDSKTDITLHPADWGFKHYDTQPPTIVSIGIHGLLPDFHDRSYINIRNFSNQETGDIPIISIPAWAGGISLQAYDTHDGATNKNGYYEAKLFVDDTLYYHIKMDMISYDEGPLIKSFVDYPLRQTQSRTEALMYRLPANQTLPVKYSYKNGVFPLFSSRESKIRLEVSDYDGNKTTAYLKVKRDEVIPEINSPPTANHYLYAESAHQQINIGDLEFNFEPNSLARNQYFMANMLESFPTCWQLGNKNEALIKPFEVCIPAHYLPITNNAVLINRDGNTTYASPGVLRDGKWCAKIHSFDRYCISEDTQAPEINILSNLKKLKESKNIIASLSDNMTYRAPGSDFTYKVYIDGEFVPCEYRELNKRLTIPIATLDSGTHTLEIRCRDYVGNESYMTKEFIK